MYIYMHGMDPRRVSVVYLPCVRVSVIQYVRIELLDNSMFKFL